eukprot:scaffold649426_cov45-Prasinocladus_malaysianus.AAC.1
MRNATERTRHLRHTQVIRDEQRRASTQQQPVIYGNEATATAPASNVTTGPAHTRCRGVMAWAQGATVAV